MVLLGMMRRASALLQHAAACGAVLLLGACVASKPEPSPMAAEPPGDGDERPAVPLPTPESISAGETTPAPQTTERARSETEAGLAIVAADTRGDGLEIARVALTLPVGALDGGQAGLPEWSGRAALGVPPGGGQQVPAVIETMERLGGGGEVEVGASTTRFSLWVPSAGWEEALEALVTSMAFPGASRAWMDRARGDMVEASAEHLVGDPMSAVLDRLLVGDAGGPRSFFEGLQDATPAESLLFRQRYYQPGGSVLALWVPDTPPQDVADRAASICAEWRPGSLSIPARPSPLPPPDLGGSVLWVLGPDQPRLAIAIGLADARDPQGAELRCMHEALTMGGVGGRLERQIREEARYAPGRVRGTPFESRWIDVDNRRFLMLESKGNPALVMRQIEVLTETRRSLVGSLPSPSEADLACRRARLLLLAERDGPESWVHHAPWDEWRKGTGFDLADQLARLDAPETLVFREAAGRFTSLPYVIVVIGGAPPDNATLPIRIVDLLPTEATRKAAEAGLEAQLAAADSMLGTVVLAMGGEHQLRRGDAYAYEVVHTGNALPDVTERVSVRGPSIQRSREILGSTIETSIDNNRAVESAGASAVELEPTEADAVRLELDRHPVQLLRLWMRGQLQFRLVGERERDTGRIAILECTSHRFPRMRLQVDLASNLIREIEWWRGNLVDGTTHIRERWSDYRILGGLRIPMHRTTELNDGSTIIESSWRDFSVDG